MTTLELFKKHRNGEVSRERFLYEVRRDSNLPWVTNTTSYDDAVKILKNKGIIKEAQFEPQNITTDPVVDRVNPYALKREIQKLLSKETELTNDSYKQALNKAAKNLTTPEAVKKAMFANAETVKKADDKLQMTPVKKGNHKDKHNEMKKAKGQETLKATSAPTKENKKTKKPKGVKVMPDKGVEGSQKIIKEISQFIKKKLTENNSYHDYHVGMQVETSEGTCTVREINGGTLTVETQDGKLRDVQMNHAKHFSEKKKNAEFDKKIDELEATEMGYEDGMKLADKLVDVIDMYNSLSDEQKDAEAERLGVDVLAKLKTAHNDIMNRIHDESNYPQQVEDDLQENSFQDEEEQLQPGDRVKVVYGNQFYGMTGTVEDVKGGFVVVSIDEDGYEYSMHSSDVEKIQDEEDYEEEIDETSYAGKGAIQSFTKDPNYSALDSVTKDKMQKKLAAGGSVEL